MGSGSRPAPGSSGGWLARLWPLVRLHRVVLSFSLVAALGALVAQIAAPAVIASAIDTALVERSRGIGIFIVILLALGLARALLAAAYRYGLYRVAFEVETDLRASLYRHLTRLSFSFYDRVQSGQIISRANADIRSVQMFLAFGPLIALSLLSFVLALGVMLTIDVPLTLLAVAPLPGVYLLGKVLRDRAFPLMWITQARLAELATIVDENVNGVRVVKSFGAEKRQLDALARSARRVRWANTATADARARLAPLMENLPRLGQVAVLGVGGWQVIDGSLMIGDLVAFNIYIGLIQVPFRLLGFVLLLTQRARASAERIYEVLDTPPDVVERPDARGVAERQGGHEVRFTGVRFAYTPDAPEILRGFDLTVGAGERVAIVGATGSGKSTVARLVPRFYDVTDGSVRIDGVDVRDLRLDDLRRTVGVILDEPFLFSASVADNISYAVPDADREAVVLAATAAQADEFIVELPEGYDTVVGERGLTLSGGQRQRIAIARALLANPSVLIFDDATSAIDVGIEAAIHDALEGLLSERTTIVIAHRLSTIALADRVVLLDDGRAVATGTHAELMATEPRYAAVLARVAEEEDRRHREADAADDDTRAALPAGMGGGLAGGGMAGGGLPGGLPGGLL